MCLTESQFETEQGQSKGRGNDFERRSFNTFRVVVRTLERIFPQCPAEQEGCNVRSLRPIERIRMRAVAAEPVSSGKEGQSKLEKKGQAAVRRYGSNRR